jgi:RNA polymerase sigma factor (TIGR02999 family)
VDQVPSQPVTELLVKWREGDPKALEALMPLVYKELRAIAHRSLRRERSDHTLQSAALVHEAYLRLADQEPLDAQNRAHFAAMAARLMREILVDYARARGAAKRGANCRVELDEALATPKKQAVDVLALDDVLNDLEVMDEQQSRIVELRFFGGLTIEETASVLQISPATVKRDWSVAKAWLSRAMKKGRSGNTAAVEKD